MFQLATVQHHLSCLAATFLLVAVVFFSVPVSGEENDAMIIGSGVNETSSRKTWSLKETLKRSQKIDALIEAHLAATDQAIRTTTNDETFLRRVYLKAIGRIPNIDEAKDFLESDSSNKRSQLVDELLDSYGYVSHQFNYFADLLRIKSRARNIPGQPYIDFVKDAIESNMPLSLIHI